MRIKRRLNKYYNYLSYLISLSIYIRVICFAVQLKTRQNFKLFGGLTKLLQKIKIIFTLAVILANRSTKLREESISLIDGSESVAFRERPHSRLLFYLSFQDS